MFQMSADAQRQQRRHRPPSPTTPLFELCDHAMAMARNEGSGLWGDDGFDEERLALLRKDARAAQPDVKLSGMDQESEIS